MGAGASSSSRVVRMNPETQPTPQPQPRGGSAGGRARRSPRFTNDGSAFDAAVKLKAMGASIECKEVSEITKFKELEKRYENTEEHARTLELVLASTEGNNLELSQKVLQLEDQLEEARNKAATVGAYDRTLFIKNQHIQRLEQEVKTAKEELVLHQLKSKRKIKKLQVDLAQAKQEAALTIMELKEKMRTLSKAAKSPAEENTPKTASGDAERGSVEDRRHILIVELSSRVSIQQEQINQLETMLQSREARIQQLEAEGPSIHCVTGNSSRQSKHTSSARNTPEDQHNEDADLTQETEHKGDAESLPEFKSVMDLDNPTIFRHSVEPDIIPKFEKSVEPHIPQESQFNLDGAFSYEPSNILEEEVVQNQAYAAGGEFNHQSECSADADMSHDSEFYVAAGSPQECLVKQENENLDDINTNYSNGEYERLLNQIGNEHLSCDEMEKTTSPAHSFLSNSESSKTMQASPRLSEKQDSPSALEFQFSKEEQNLGNEVSIFGSNHIDECCQLDEEDSF
ncbi:coiled-coil domain-containing protein 192 [Ambystoma mexicanum]|uniref:coiled-coil domain-containing protein 192 n=1 Tax=Ambystoma mexicanum TaxID=8296 RepID=UPI0037E866D3